MLMGQYTHNLDEKGRIIIPSRLREKLSNVAVVTKGFDGCLSLYSKDEWEKFQTSLLTLPTNMMDARKHIRVLVGSASEVEFDKQGRINLAKNLLESAAIKKECVIVGVLDHIEIWAKETWDKYYEDAAASLEEVAEKLTNYGKE